MRITIIVMLSLLVMSAQAQMLKRKKKSAETSQSAQPTSLSPSSSTSEKKYGPKKSRKGKLAEPTYGSEEDYYKRIAELQKTRRKNEKMLDKPQYTDPSYFGHKRPPKKRPVGKMKFCKECGLRH
jgi:hypothetical protein